MNCLLKRWIAILRPCAGAYGPLPFDQKGFTTVSRKTSPGWPYIGQDALHCTPRIAITLCGSQIGFGRNVWLCKIAPASHM